MANEYIAYYRVSTAQQGKSGLGLEAQRRDIQLFMQNYCENCIIIDEYTDVLSGKTSARPELQKALQRCRETGATLLVAKLDRLSRDVHFISGLMKDKKLNFTVASMPEAKKEMLHIYAVMAEMERDFISARTKAALAEAKARGTKLGGLRESTQVANEARRKQADNDAEQMRQILTPLRQQGLSIRAIVDVLQSQGIKTSSATLGRQLKRLSL